MLLIFMDIPVFAGKPKNPQSPWPHVAKFSDYLGEDRTRLPRHLRSCRLQPGFFTFK